MWKRYLRDWGVSALPILAVAMSAMMKLSGNAQVTEPWTKAFGYPLDLLLPIGVLELVCLLIYVIPRTAVLGAILLTGYLGGAVATHVRVGDNFAAPAVLGVLVWLGLYLRDARLRALVPLTSVSR